MNTLYTIETERRANLAGIVAGYFKGFNLQHGTGYYVGLAEESTTIRILTNDSVGQRASVYDLAEDIRRINEQQQVLVTEHRVHVTQVEARKL